MAQSAKISSAATTTPEKEFQTLSQAISQPWVVKEIYGFLLVTAVISVVDFNILWNEPNRQKVLIAAGVNVAALAGYSISYDFRAKSRRAASGESSEEKSGSEKRPSKETRILIFGTPVLVTFDRCLNLFSILFTLIIGIVVYTRL